MSDLEIAERCAQGDRKAREELYGKYSSRLLSLCMRYVPDRPSAEDCMHDSFVKILEVIRKFRYNGEGSLYSWMARVTINHCLDSAKKRRRIKESFIEEEKDMPDIMVEDSPSDAHEIPPNVLRKMVEDLPIGYRTVFMLYTIDGLSHDEISKLLGIKAKSSSSNLARARMMLSAKIKDYYEKN